MAPQRYDYETGSDNDDRSNLTRTPSTTSNKKTDLSSSFLASQYSSSFASTPNAADEPSTSTPFRLLSNLRQESNKNKLNDSGPFRSQFGRRLGERSSLTPTSHNGHFSTQSINSPPRGTTQVESTSVPRAHSATTQVHTLLNFK
jgi:hypothetical protein